MCQLESGPRGSKQLLHVWLQKTMGNGHSIVAVQRQTKESIF